MYRIYASVNAADTCRDPDDIHITELGFASSEEHAAAFMNKYIREHFFAHDKNDYKVYKSGNDLRAQEYCSWGRTLCADHMNIVDEV